MKQALLAVTVIALLARALPVVAQHDEGKAPAGEGAASHQNATGAHDAPHATPRGGGHDASHDVGPVPPEHESKRWVGVVLILVATLFVLAAVIGPIVRAHAPPAEMPPTHSHDEPPGASHHHGSSGTINPDHGDHDHLHGHGHH